MSLKKRGKTWHTHFFVDGQRFRQSLETSDWREAQAKEKTLIASAKQGKLSTTSEDFARLPFEEAAAKYLVSRLPELAESSQQKERQLLTKPTAALQGCKVARFVCGGRSWVIGSGVFQPGWVRRSSTWRWESSAGF